MSRPGSPLLRGRLHVVTGKGGTGKTTVAASLALALAGRGRRVLLCEVEGRQGIASVFDVAPLPYAERRIAVGADGGEIWALAIDPEGALREYLDLFYHLGRASRALDRFGVIDFATTIAPGLRDVLLVGKVYEATRRQPGTRSAERGQMYDAIVLDAPPTGRIGRFLNVNSEVAGIARMGPIRNQATAIMNLLRSQQTRVHLVTTLEEMPVQETLDGIAEVGDLGLPLGAIVVNMERDPVLAGADLEAARTRTVDLDRVSASLAKAGIEAPDAFLAALADQAFAHAQRVDMEAEQRHRLSVSGVPLVGLPYISDGIDVGALYDFADRIRGEQPVAARWSGLSR